MSTTEDAAPETNEERVGTVEDLLKRADAIKEDAEKARINLLHGSSPFARNAANYLHKLWPILAKASPNTATRVQYESPLTGLKTSSHEGLVNEQAELLSHVASLLDHDITPATPDYPGVSPAALLELQKRRELDHLAESEWWVEHEMKDKSSNIETLSLLDGNIVRSQSLQARLRTEIHTAHAAEAVADTEKIYERAAGNTQNDEGDFVAFRDACRLMVARHGMERRHSALTRRAHAAARDGDDSALREIQDAARQIMDTAEAVGARMHSLEESVEDDSVRDAIAILHRTARTHRR